MRYFVCEKVQSLYILIHKPGSRQVAILAVYVGTMMMMIVSV